MIVSAIPFTGNKRRLWGQIEPLLPEGYLFVDMLCGGGTVALNATEKYESVWAMDVMEPVIELHKAFQIEKFLERITSVHEAYPQTKEGYLSLRKAYNVEDSPAKLLNLILRSNTNYMRFNKSLKFNVPYGERCHYNLERTKAHHEACKRISFYCNDFRESTKRLLCNVSPDGGYPVVVYMDSPYQTCTATYNESGGWKGEDDEDLLDCILELHSKGFKIAASNVFENKGKVNTKWVEFCDTHEDKFTIHHLNRSYNNCSFRKSTSKTDEVLIVSK